MITIQLTYRQAVVLRMLMQNTIDSNWDYRFTRSFAAILRKLEKVLMQEGGR
jgi:hypothetical protein